ncbi:rod shape-determining protein MreC [Robbsia andropogonis]|uniref:Cell shape-determining protein MreC n=1 Tax=Robbsia andropogonis TaxID=28092 RepID=A0A0F5K3C6_9BURK|nr:rod shape-determining protein MreC [Robbsia andropogonis]KKB64616.1 rod shape-determining protein MreC [Robbsia andropogonis]
MDHSPPPLFRQGPSALVRLIVCMSLAIGLLVTDAHFHTLTLFRQVIVTALYPLQRAALAPRDLIADVFSFAVSNETLRAQVSQLQARNLQLGLEASRAAEMQVENSHLRSLLQLTQRAPITPIPAEIQYDTRDPFSQKVIIDHGLQAGVENGAPVITEDGLMGQITRVFPLQSEVTLLTDRDQAVPVQIVRTGVRSVVYGSADTGMLDMRFVPSGADVKPGDELVTSGLDGLYPPGLPVARIVRVDKQSDSAFAKVWASPIAKIRGVRQLLVLHYREALPTNPVEEEKAEQAKNGKGAKKSKSASATKAGATESASAPDAASAASTAEVTPAEATAAALAASGRPAAPAMEASAPAAAAARHGAIKDAAPGTTNHKR